MSVTLTGLSGLLSKAPVNVQQMRDLRDHEHLRQRSCPKPSVYAFFSLDVHSTFFYTFANSYLLMTLFHSFTFANAQGTELRTGRVSISCLPHTLSPFSPF